MQKLVYNQDPNTHFNAFLNKFLTCINKHLPMKKNSRKRDHQSKPWLTKHLLLQIQKKHRLYRKVHKNPQNVDIKHKLKSLSVIPLHMKKRS